MYRLNPLGWDVGQIANLSDTPHAVEAIQFLPESDLWQLNVKAQPGKKARNQSLIRCQATLGARGRRGGGSVAGL